MSGGNIICTLNMQHSYVWVYMSAVGDSPTEFATQQLFSELRPQEASENCGGASMTRWSLLQVLVWYMQDLFSPPTPLSRILGV